MMHRWGTFFLVCLFAGMALFGVLTMLHMDHANAACLPAPMGLVACPETVGHALAHLTAFQQLGEATPLAGVVGILLGVLLLASSIFLLAQEGRPKVASSLARRRNEHVLGSPLSESLLRWIARLQLSPSFS